jgi:hypothetical protein
MKEQMIPTWGFHLRTQARWDAKWPRPAPVAISLSAALLALLLCALLAAARAEANAGPPFYTDGQVAAEPSGLEGIAIAHETLAIDMRQLRPNPRKTYDKTDSPEIRNPIGVSVAYSITNRGPARGVALVFASGAPNTAGFSVMLDGQPIAAQPAISVTLPAEWMPPATTPGLEGADLLYLDPPSKTVDASEVVPGHHYPSSSARSLTSTYAFTVTIPTGESALTIQYRAEPQQFRSGGYTNTLNSYQFAYVLAPARAWDGFGGLDVTVRLPACWLAASRPGLTRVGDELRVPFESVPADALAITMAPCDAAKPVSFCAPAGLILPLGALGIVLYRRTRRAG